jgi:hypothetical protein
VLDGGRFNQRLLVVLDRDTLSDQLLSEPAGHVCRLSLAIATPRSGELQFRH